MNRLEELRVEERRCHKEIDRCLEEMMKSLDAGGAQSLGYVDWCRELDMIRKEIRELEQL